MLQTRTFVAAPPQPKIMPPPNPPSSRSGKGKGKRKGRAPKENTKESSRKKRKTKGKGKARMDLEDHEESALSSGDDNVETGSEDHAHVSAPRRSGRMKKLLVGSYIEKDADADGDLATDPDAEMSIPPNDPTTPDVLHLPNLQHDEGLADSDQSNAMNQGEDHTLATDVDAVMHDTRSATNVIEIALEIEDEEQKPKPMLQLRYQGFGIYGHCLCVVVEPFPPIQSSSRAPSVALLRETSLRAPSLGFSPTTERLREGTPLFLPEHDRRSETPAPFRQQNPNSLFNHPRFDEAGADDDNGGMMEFSQALNPAGEFQAGGTVDNDDEMDAAVFFGDADEGREL